MLKIAVFDSGANVDQLEDILVRLLFDRCEFGYEAYTSAADIAEIDFRDFPFDLVFIEVNSDLFPGIEIAKRIREIGHIHTEIILTSTDDAFALYGYKIRAFDYLLKPIPIRTLTETIDRYFSYNEADTVSYFTYKVAGVVQRVRYDDIFYFMSSGRKCNIVSKNSEDIEFYAKLDEVEEKLEEEKFLRIHQSYIVQLKYIKYLTKEGVTLSNGLFVPISQKRYGEVKKKFMKYLEIEE